MNRIAKRFIANLLFIFFVFAVNAQTNPDDYWLNHGFTNGGTVYTNSGNFYDDGGFGVYNSGQDWAVRFCSENGNPITVDFNGFRTDYRGNHPMGDDYIDYDYITIDFSGSDQLVAYSFDTPQFSFTSADGCIKFAFHSKEEGISMPDSGWVAEISANPPPVNNDPCDAIELNVGNVCSPTFFTNKGAWDTRNIGSPSCYEDFYGGDVWFSAVVPESGELNLKTFAGSLTYAVLTLYTGDCNNLTEFECIDIPQTMPVYTFMGLTPGERVYIRIFGDRAKSGTFGICAIDPNAGISGYKGPGGVGDSISNKIWLRADQGVYSESMNSAENGQNVTLWEDQSGNNNNVSQSDPANQPEFREKGMNSRNSISFDGDSHHLITESGHLAAPLVLFSVHEFLSSTEQTVLTLGTGSDDNTLSISREGSAGHYYTFSGLPHYGLGLPDDSQILEAGYYVKEPFHTYKLNGTAQTVNYSGEQVSTDGTLILGSDRNIENLFTGNLSEVLMYTKKLNEAQEIIVGNYLSSKYNIPVQNDFYDFEDTHPEDLAGIGRINSQNIHTKAQSAGLLSIGGATELDDNEFVLFAHDGGDDKLWVSQELPVNSGDLIRISREWKVAVTGTPGLVSVGLDTISLPVLPEGYAGYNLMLDSDGDFSQGAVSFGLIPSGEEIISNNIPLQDGDYLTISAVKTMVNFRQSAGEGLESLEHPVIGVELNYAASQSITVGYTVTSGTATGEGVDYSLNEDVLVFDPGERYQEIIPFIFDDSIVEQPDEYFIIQLEVLDGNVIPGDTMEFTYTILDDDIALIVSASDSVIGECEESVTTLQARITGKNPVSYTWSPASGLADSQALITEAKPQRDTWYTFSMIDSEGENYTDSVFIEVVPIPEVPLIEKEGLTEFCEGDSLILTGPEGYSYLWNTGDTLSDLTVKLSGSYRLRVNDSRCFSDSSEPVEVTVFELPPKPEILLSRSPYFCEGDSVILSGPQGVDYNWNNGDTSSEITVYGDGEYILTINDGRCSSLPSDTIVTRAFPVPEKPEISTQGSLEFCEGDSVILTGPPGYSYTWNTGESGESLSVKTGGEYSLVVSNPGCSSESSDPLEVLVYSRPEKPEIFISGEEMFCQGDSTLLYTGEADIYEWSNGVGQQTQYIKESGDYTLIVSNEHCSSLPSDTVQIVVNPIPDQPVISPSGPILLPLDGEVILSTVEADGYLWSTDEVSREIRVSVTGNYTVSTVNTYNCWSIPSEPVEVTKTDLLPAPELSLRNDTSFCEGGSIEVSGPEGYRYYWSTGDTSMTITLSESSQISLTVKNDDGMLSLESESRQITVFENPEADVLVNDVSCFGGMDGMLEVQIQHGLPPYQIDWDQDISGTSVSDLNSGNYYALITDENGCFVRIEAEVQQPTEISIEGELMNARCPDASDGDIKVTVSGGTPPYNYEWDDGTPGSVLENLSPGSYTLLVTDFNGCDKSGTFSIGINSDVCFEIPEIITPNGDGMNDEWIIEGIEVYSGVSVEIYDRSGKRVFYSKGYDDPFDGRFNGKELPMESYHYFIDLNNGTPVLKGNITIVR